MFKSLRKRLSRFEQELEDEIEKELGESLERELEEAIEAPRAETARETPGGEAPGVAKGHPGAKAGTKPTGTPSPETVAEAERPSTEPEKASGPPAPQPEPAAPRTAPPGDARRADAPPEPKPAPREASVVPPKREAAAEAHAEPGSPPEPRPEAQPAAPKVEPLPRQKPAAETPVRPDQPVATPRRGPRGGPVRKPTREELEASIARELEAELTEAVASQREIESVIETRGAAGVRLSEKKLDELLWELEIALMESDVAVPVIDKIKESVREQLLEAEIGRRQAHELVRDVLRTAIKRVLKAKPLDFDAFVRDHTKPVVIMFVGVNGTGKTTSIAKIAHRLKQQGLSSVLAAGDTFRAGAIEQLTLHADRLGVKIVKHGPGSDPAAVAYDAIEHAKARAKDVVLLDTAGRMQTNVNLMEEMAKIKRVARPHLILFVGDSLAGNDAVEQASRFNEVVGIDGVILTKVDADAKGGAALSVAQTIGKPLVFIGVGQEYDDQIPFNADWMVDRLFGDEAAEEAEMEA